MIDQWISWLPDLMAGLKISLMVTGFSLLFGLPLGLVLAFGMINRSKTLRYITIGLVELGRGIPLLVVLYLVYFGLPTAGVVLSSLAAAVVGISLNTGAYTSEIFRAGLLSVPRGHVEAAQSLGLNWIDEARYIVLPQAIRAVVPPLMSYSVIVFQATSLGFAIALSELLNSAYQIGSVSFQFLSVFALTGLIYAVLSIAVSRLVDTVHTRTSV
ncbi:amino acid ABC transporter permease [Paeniglutamicibacter quisquiliarum]|uniref:amino acid ABC transporter permease n=1 Tax=Paeniglutamicibacter quisquiliarum TaxID=2849498 RepID=UPI0020C404E4|nr:amino acid ABC transporter permease [Paeniglutamicibacter quisquiliarum]